MASNDEQRSATTIITTAAQSIAARLIANETTAKFTKAEISTTNLFNQSVTELQVLTSLDNVQQTADINTVTVINNNTVNVNVAIDQTKAPNNYQMNSVGLFAVDGDGKEVLYSVTVLKDPVYIHQDAMGSALGIDLETVVGQASNVEISVNPAGAVTNEILKATLADYVKTDDVKSLIPATVIDGSKPADFKEPVTLEKGAVDGAGNVIATTKNLADGDAETLTSAKKYADTKTSGKADDSAVVHNTPTILPSGTDLNVVTSSGYYYIAGAINKPENADDWTIYQVVDLRSSLSNGFQIAYDTNENFQSMRTWSGKGWTPWKLLADDSKVVHLTDMRKPASQVASIDEVNAKQDKLDYTPANAANVVDRNPDTGTVSKPTDFTNLTVNGGKSVATRDDLKSLEASAWRQLDNQYVSADGYAVSPDTVILYKIEEDSKRLYVQGTIRMIDNNSSIPTVSIALTSIVKTILTVSGGYLGFPDGYASSNGYIYHDFLMSTEGITLKTNSVGIAVILYSPYITYDELI
ncbi:pyocin knob domain-containing protein [Levilactobacillus brevis]|uniref:pyocin knob domain-containing protein n=1 Tax=Levilactobacillus brevis TaxID=1580 RepID=UPI00374E8338